MDLKILQYCKAIHSAKGDNNLARLELKHSAMFYFNHSNQRFSIFTIYFFYKTNLIKILFERMSENKLPVLKLNQKLQPILRSKR